MNPNNFLRLSPEVAAALEAKSPVVAFETTILSFGLPVPINVEVGLGCESIARDHGCIPATVASLDGKVCVGLSHEELLFFCHQASQVVKVNPQNLASVVSQNRPGAFTVASSMQACAMAGLEVFATGGIGGVHRGLVEHGPDISADLMALARLPVTVICAGAKSILDIPATLEVLETLGVPVVGFKTRTFPQFFTAESEFHLETSFEDIRELARFIRVHRELGGAGILVATPVPAEASINRSDLDTWIQQALEESRKKGITGKQTTPFLLSRLVEISQGRTVQTNIALIRNNAALASRLAVELAEPNSA